VGAYTLGAGFRGAGTHFAVNKIVIFSRNLDHNMLKSGLFLEKKENCKNAEALGVPPLNSRWLPAAGGPPQTPSYSSRI